MSKSKGNGIDPLTLIEGATVEELKRPILDARPSNIKELIRRIETNFPDGFKAVGADAMRWTLIYSVTEGEQVRLSLSRFTDGRNFVTKLWNGAGRIIQAVEAEAKRSRASEDIAGPTDEDTWILARLDSTIRSCRTGLDRFDFGSMAQDLYHFVWDDFCSWALELCKTRLTSDDDSVRRGAIRVMGSVLADTLRLLHPIVPFVTEELWSKLQPQMCAQSLWLESESTPDPLLVLNHFPTARNEPQPDIEARFAIVQRLVSSVRQLRATSNIKDNLKITIAVKALSEDTRPMLERANNAITFLARLDQITFVEQREKGMAAQYDPDFELYVDLGKYLDLKEEISRLDKMMGKTEAEIKTCEGTLSNPKFVERAPEAKVKEKQAQLAAAQNRLEKLQSSRHELAELTAE
jgi:valyl-tRNA synthetase